MSSYPIDYYKRKRKKNSPLQLGYTKDVAKLSAPLIYRFTTFPPDFSIFACAEPLNLCA